MSRMGAALGWGRKRHSSFIQAGLRRLCGSLTSFEAFHTVLILSSGRTSKLVCDRNLGNRGATTSHSAEGSLRMFWKAVRSRQMRRDLLQLERLPVCREPFQGDSGTLERLTSSWTSSFLCVMEFVSFGSALIFHLAGTLNGDSK